MVRYDVATSILVIRSILILNIPLPITSFIPQQTPSSWTLPEIPAGAAVLRVTEKRSASVAASYYDNDNEEEEEEKDGQSSSTSTSTSTSNKPLASGGGSGTAYLDTLGGKDDVIIRRERKVLDQSGTGGGKTTTYDVVLPLNKNVQSSSSSFPSSSTTVTEATKPPPATRRLGIQLRQISARGEISDTSLDLDSLRYLSVAQEVYRDMNDATPDNVGEEGPLGSVQPLNLPVNFVLNPNMKGIIVSGVVRGSVAWDAGVRSGDFLMATSATLGDKIWPKSTLDGVRSAVSSRKIMSSTMKFQFKRDGFSITSSDEIVKDFEMSLMRPLGVNIADKEDGFVTVTGFTEKASMLVRERLMIGDRVVAVESSMGGNMWPVSNVNGAVSACTSRLPGQPVRIRFERIVKGIGGTNANVLDKGDGVNAMEKSIERSQSRTDEKLLARCCDVLKRYISVYDPKSPRAAAVPALVADRVLETLADASATLDPKTLSLVMNSFILCSKPEDAIRAFEAAVGMSADGSKHKTDVVIRGKQEGSRIIADITAIDLFTGTDLIRAHAQIGDFNSARRVLAAMEGDDILIDGIPNLRWPGQVKVDTRSYNSVLAAAAAMADKEAGLTVAIDQHGRLDRYDGRGV